MDLLGASTMVLALVTLGAVIAAWQQLRQGKAIASADLLAKLYRDFRSEQCYQRLNNMIDNKELRVDRVKEIKDVLDLDSYLGFFEVIKHCIDERVVDGNRAHRLFGYYVLKAMYYEPIHNYIMETADYWLDFRALVEQMLPLEEKRRGLKRQEVIDYYKNK